MRKSFLSIALAAVMVTGVFGALPASSETVVPAEPLVTDPVGDANYLNDQGFAGTGIAPATVPESGDNSTPADGGSVSDVMAAWLTADADNVYAHFQTEAPGPATLALFYRLRVDPGVGSNCLWFQAGAPGAGNAQGVSTPSLRTISPCDPVQTVSEGAEFIQEEGPDGTGIHTIKIPRVLSAYLVDGTTLATPKVDVTHYTLSPPVPGVTGGAGLTAPTIDQTKPGLDWVIASGPGSGGPPVVEEPPTGTDPDEPKKKNCKKKKGKAKKKCKKFNKSLGGAPTGNGCDAYVPGEQGAEAETLIVKDEHTAEAPLELVIDQDPGAVRAEVRGHVFANIQVDSEAAEAGLFVRYSFPDYEDHDLYVRYADGALAAQAAGFNPIVEAPLVNDGTTVAGHSERGAEQVDGVRTADCAGYTADFVNFLGEGGEYTVTMWLGEIENDPQAPAA